MINFIKRALYTAAKVAVSAALFTAGYYCFGHDSSAAFNLGMFLFGAGACHYFGWPKLTFNVENKDD